eukprot:1156183-Pelagomonas_calceolata.AAC.12
MQGQFLRETFTGISCKDSQGGRALTGTISKDGQVLQENQNLVQFDPGVKDPEANENRSRKDRASIAGAPQKTISAHIAMDAHTNM